MVTDSASTRREVGIPVNRVILFLVPVWLATAVTGAVVLFPAGPGTPAGRLRRQQVPLR